MNSSLHTVVNANCLKELKNLEEGSIDLIVTSPPYNMGKGYDGYNDNREWGEYLGFLESFCIEAYRVIKPNGHIFVNVADRGISNKDAEKKVGSRGNFHVFPTHSFIINYFYSLEAHYLNPIIWVKSQGCSTQFGSSGRFSGSYPFPNNCHTPSEFEYILHFRKNGKKVKVSKEIKEKSRLSKDRWYEISSQIWNVNNTRNPKHPAVFPLEIPKRLIEGWSFKGDIVLDPFAGVGNTAIAAKKLERRSLSIEISSYYCSLITKGLLDI